MNQEPSGLDRRLDALASLGDPVRRTLYKYVIDRGEAVGRDEAAVAAGISRSLAAYHMDKLAEAGLFDVTFARRTGRRGPGAGRTAKLYLRAREPVGVTLPARDYELIARLLATAVDADTSGAAEAALYEAARALGAEIAREAISAASAELTAGQGNGRPPSPPTLRGVLAGRGYEPYDDGGVVRLHNCPFERVANEHRELVCGANLAVVEGMVEVLGPPDARVVLDPADDRCCVAVAAAALG